MRAIPEIWRRVIKFSGFITAILLLSFIPLGTFADEDAKEIDLEDEGPNFLLDYKAAVVTNKGRFVIEFLPELAPVHTLNFIALAKTGFFDGLTFHRYVEGFVVQGGDPLGNGTGGPGYSLPAEIYDQPLHVKGAVGMARTSDDVNPERRSSGSQFYVCLEDVHRLDGKYTVFGNVVEGMDVVMELRQDDIIEKVIIRHVSNDFGKGIEKILQDLEAGLVDEITGLNYDKLQGVITTSKGVVKIKFYADTAPGHIKNFIKLTRDGFYNGLTFHRYEPGFVIQGGDPDGTGSGGPGYQVDAEISTLHPHIQGTVAAARLGDQVNPEKKSSGSQFYICLEKAPHLDGAYTVWGQVIEGMDVVMQLRQGDIMEKIEILPLEG